MPVHDPKDEIYRLRLRLGMSQAKFAKELGVIPNSVSRWERGERDPSTAVLKLARMLVEQQRNTAVAR